MNGENMHNTGRQHRRPEDDSPGYKRVVLRGCGGERDYFGDFDCSHGYTWSCEECPVLREQWRQEELAERREKAIEAWRNAEFEGRTHLGPKPPGPTPKTLSHFASVEEWGQHLEAVRQAQQSGTPF